jgi:hypothetical protein
MKNGAAVRDEQAAPIRFETEVQPVRKTGLWWGDVRKHPGRERGEGWEKSVAEAVEDVHGTSRFNR